MTIRLWLNLRKTFMGGILKRINQGVTVNDETLAFDVIKEVGPGGTYLVHDHTLDWFRLNFTEI